MNFKRYLSYLNHFTTRTLVLVVSLFIILSSTAYSNEGNYQLTKVAQLEHRLITQTNWKQLITNPKNKQHFVIRESGQAYLIDDDKINPKAILDMSVSQSKDSSLFKLTAIQLHPSFSLQDRVGYNTFYTAHIESLNQKSKTNRLQERDENIELRFDAVITEWKFTSHNHQKVDLSTKREVLRIGVPDSLMVIKQMSFSPYIKSWNDNFGLLYIALNGDEKWSKPLYSGVILRIDPAKFGLRSFSVPNNNPYLENSNIHNAIYLLGGQKIKQFIWPDKNSDHLLVSHQYKNKHLLSLTTGRDDWRDSTIKQVVYESDDPIHDVLIYQGRQLPSLRSKLLLLRKKEPYWFVDSLAFKLSDKKTIRNEKKPQLEWQITSELLPTNSQIILGSNHSGEIFLLEKTISILFRLTQQTLFNKSEVVNSEEPNTMETDSSNNGIFILLTIFVLLGIIYCWYKRNSHLVRARVKQQFASFELSESCQQITLYRRRQNNVETVINIADIVTSEIKLNERSISVINNELGHSFNNINEESLRIIFANEKVDKMVDGKVREISLLLADKKMNTYAVLLYLRKGSNRLTKKSYTKVVDELIDWCWLVGNIINAEKTEKRKVKPMRSKKKNVVIKPDNQQRPLHSQTDAIRSVSQNINQSSESLVTDDILSALNVVKEAKSSALTSDNNNSVNQNDTIDTELVNALEKLVALKQQGFLTIDEFSKAKEKLLERLLSK